MLENIVTGPVEFKVDLCDYIILKKKYKKPIKKLTLLSRPHPASFNQD